MTRASPSLTRRAAARMLRGFTLVEVLVGLALLAALGGALSALQIGTLRANRSAQVRLQATALLADELVLQRVIVGAAEGAADGGIGGIGGAADACANMHMPDEWSCAVEVRCLPLPGLAACAARVFTVELRLPSGEPLQARGASFIHAGALP